MRLTGSIMAFAVLGWSLPLSHAQLIVYDFDSTPAHSPLPLDQTVAGITAHLSFSPGSYGYSLQVPADVLAGFTPVGFSGNCIAPSTVYPSDLLISFSQSLSDISLMYSPQEIATDSSCTMRITAYLGPTVVGTTTTTINPPGTWPTGILSFGSMQPFDNVVVHYDKPPVTGGDYGPIFMVDNLSVTPVPEPATTAVVMLAIAIGAGSLLRARR